MRTAANVPPAYSPAITVTVLTICFVALALPALSHAQGTLGVVTETGHHFAPCNFPVQGADAWYPQGNQTLTTCYLLQVSHFPVTGASQSYLPPMDAYVAVTNQPSPKTPLGTIILHDGNTGTTFFSSGGYNASGLGTSYVSQYWSDQFETVQVAWADSWWDNSSDPPVKSVLQEACRPATLLSWINSHYLQSASKPVCAQGHSAGAAAIAYPLAWYGADRNTPGGYLDTVLFTSGPTLSDIKAGCQYPQATGPQNVCSGGVCVGGAAQWPDCQQYMNGNMDCNTVPNLHPPGTVNAAKGVDRMTIGLSNQYASETCNNYNQDPNDNTKDLNAVWANMSLVQPTGLGNNYNYPHTSVSAFLCSGPDLGPQSPPAPGTSEYINYSNNSALQAWDYLSIVHGSTLQNGGTPYIYRVDSCTDPEQIWTSAAFATTTIGLQPGYIASYQAMETNCSVPH